MVIPKNSNGICAIRFCKNQTRHTAKMRVQGKVADVGLCATCHLRYVSVHQQGGGYSYNCPPNTNKPLDYLRWREVE